MVFLKQIFISLNGIQHKIVEIPKTVRIGENLQNIVNPRFYIKKQTKPPTSNKNYIRKINVLT